MNAFTGSFFKASLSLAALLAAASMGACNNGDIPIGNDQQPISCATPSDCPMGQGCAADHLCAPVCASDADCSGGDVCTAGLCAAPAACMLTTCGGQCVDTQTDDANCGACGVMCPSGDTCVAGACTAGSPVCMVDAQCPMGQVCVNTACVVPPPCMLTTCGSQCVDTQTDDANCGACGTMCPSGDTCVAGVCTAGSLVCMVDAQCPMGQVCVNTACVVPPPCMLTTCGSQCVDLETDAANCGACGTMCPSGDACVAGACTATACMNNSDCPMGQTCMGGVCVP